MMGRGCFTEDLKNKYNITLKQLRLLPYFQYLLMNNACVNPAKIDDEERKILAKWRDEGKITFSMLESCTCTKDFWDWMNEILWDSYVPHYERSEGADNEQ